MNNKTNNGRRKFIKTTGTAAGITLMPSASVWGACNASGISGGSKAIGVTCTIPELSGGWSPGQWKKLTNAAVCANRSHAVHCIKKIFGEPATDILLDQYINGMASFMASTTVTYGDGATVEKVQFNLAEVFDGVVTGDSKMDLAAMYLNVYFGLAGWNPTLNTTGTLVLEDFWGSLSVQHGTESPASSPRWSKPSDSVITNAIVSQYWEDDSPAVQLGDTMKIPISLTPVSCN